MTDPCFRCRLRSIHRCCVIVGDVVSDLHHICQVVASCAFVDEPDEIICERFMNKQVHTARHLDNILVLDGVARNDHGSTFVGKSVSNRGFNGCVSH